MKVTSFNGYIYQNQSIINAHNLKMEKERPNNAILAVEDAGYEFRLHKFNASLGDYKRALINAQALPFSAELNTIDLDTGKSLKTMNGFDECPDDIHIAKEVLMNSKNGCSVYTEGFASLNVKFFEGSIVAKKGINQYNKDAIIGKDSGVLTDGKACITAKEINASIEADFVDYDNKDGVINSYISANNVKINADECRFINASDTVVASINQIPFIDAKNDVFILVDPELGVLNSRKIISDKGNIYFVGIDEKPDSVQAIVVNGEVKCISEEKFEEMKKTHTALIEMYKEG